MFGSTATGSSRVPRCQYGGDLPLAPPRAARRSRPGADRPHHRLASRGGHRPRRLEAVLHPLRARAAYRVSRRRRSPHLADCGRAGRLRGRRPSSRASACSASCSPVRWNGGKSSTGCSRRSAFLSSGAELAGLALYEVDFGRRTARVDDRFREMFGVPVERVDGAEAVAYWMDRLHPDDRPSVLHLRQRLVRRPRSPVRHGVSLSTSGDRRAVDPARRPGEHARRRGAPLRSFGVLRDITATASRAEGELAQLGQRLIAAHEAERALLARELHDDVTQRLAVLAIDVGRVELAIPGRRARGRDAERSRRTRASQRGRALARLPAPPVRAGGTRLRRGTPDGVRTHGAPGPPRALPGPRRPPTPISARTPASASSAWRRRRCTT